MVLVLIFVGCVEGRGRGGCVVFFWGAGRYRDVM